jgi:uncharacterized delta-60 repeat protein
VLVYNFTGVVGGAESGEAVVVQPDGHLIVGGGYRPEDGSARKAFLMRLDANGALDPGFGSGGTVTMTTMTFVNALALQGSTLVAAGERCSSGDSSCVTAVGRFSGTTAAVESGFGMNGIYTMPFGGSAPSRAYALLTTSTKMFISGSTTSGASTDSTFARYDGLSLDSTFGSFGVQVFGAATQDAAYGLAPYGTKYYAAEGAGSFAVRRVLSTGAGDTAFGVQGRRSVAFAGTGGTAYGVVVSGSTVVGAGYAYTSTLRSRMALARFTSSGALDTAFSDDGQLLLIAGGDDASAHAVVRQSTGKLVVGGWSRKDGAKKRAALVRVLD